MTSMTIYQALAYIAPVLLALLTQIVKGKIALQGKTLLLAVMGLGAALSGLFIYLGDQNGLQATLTIVMGALTPMGTWAAFLSKDSLTPAVGEKLGGTGDGGK